jgi:actin-related protein 10
MIILEFGSCSLKAGTSGDIKPRVFYYSLDNDSVADWRDGGWGLLEKNYKLLFDYPPPSKEFLHSLLISTLNRCWQELCCQDQKILIVENPFLPLIVKDSIQQVLLQKFAKEISILPSPIASVLSFGSTSGLVVDVGYLESRAYLVYDGRVLENYTGFYPIGCFIY